MPFLTLKNNNDIFYLYNTTYKIYSDNLIKCKKKSFDTFKFINNFNKHTGTYSEEEKELKTKKYLKSVKSNIIDLAYNNKELFDYFITLTFNPKDKDNFPNGYNHEQAIELLKKWIDNQKHQNKNLSYILVPEFHESGQLHFHGLVGGADKWILEQAINPKTKKEIIKNGSRIYNLSNYKLGFTTVSYIKSREAVTNYISKYATKELITLKSKKRYWYSRNLKKPIVDFDYLDITLKENFINNDIIYNDIFSTENREIELLNYQLPIIDNK